jgi:Ser/Thr protein kinase RdoA (MazF antagonist)
MDFLRYVGDQMIKRLLKNWNIPFDDIIEVQEDVWSVDKDYFLKANKNSNWGENLQIYKVLRELGIPAPEVICTNQDKDYLVYNEKNYFLTRKLVGIHLSKEEVMDDKAKAQLVGKAIAKLHKAFSEMTNGFEFYDNNFVDELNGWIRESLAKFAVGSFAYRIFDECVRDLELNYDKLERHLIHRDMHLGNLLFGDNKITGYIDFDLSQINARIFDIAYFLVGWLVGEIDNQGFTDSWKKTVTIIIEEYDKELGLTEQEINSLGIMMCCIELLFVAYFYQIDDVENALKAEECLCWLWDNF